MISTLPKPQTPNSIPMPPGVADLYSLIAFLSDPKKVESHLKKVQTVTDSANKAIETVGDAKKIPQLLRSAEEKRDLADKIVSEAQQKAQNITDNATKDAQSALGAISGRVEALQADEARINAQMAGKTKDFTAREGAIKSEEQTLVQKAINLDVLQAKLDRQAKEIDRKTRILSQL